MPCYSPNALARDSQGETRFISGHHIRESHLFKPKIGILSGINKTIARKIATRRDFIPHEVFPIACKSCIGCRLYSSREWAIRCTHENQMHEESSFLTLTYNDQHLPKNQTLMLEDMQKFFYRLRSHLKRQGENSKFRYMYCGEYGDTTNRPHYHALMFGLDFPDKKLYTVMRGNRVYQSPTLDKVWGKGFAHIGSVTFESSAYVARYINKKVNGPAKHQHYAIKDEDNQPIVDEDGMLLKRKPEYALASRMKPYPEALGGGLGTSWFEKYHTDVYPSDEVVMKGMKMRPPAYYDKLLERLNPDLFETIKQKRKDTLEELDNDDEKSMFRLIAKEKVKLAQVSKLIRPL